VTTRDQPSSAELFKLDKTSEELDTDDVVERSDDVENQQPGRPVRLSPTSHHSFGHMEVA
jgi:hypothetical protein